jgi:hypothetical protein
MAVDFLRLYHGLPFGLQLAVSFLLQFGFNDLVLGQFVVEAFVCFPFEPRLLTAVDHLL